jgi:hypothetical protein
MQRQLRAAAGGKTSQRCAGKNFQMYAGNHIPYLIP